MFDLSTEEAWKKTMLGGFPGKETLRIKLENSGVKKNLAKKISEITAKDKNINLEKIFNKIGNPSKEPVGVVDTGLHSLPSFGKNNFGINLKTSKQESKNPKNAKFQEIPQGQQKKKLNGNKASGKQSAPKKNTGHKILAGITTSAFIIFGSLIPQDDQKEVGVVKTGEIKKILSEKKNDPDKKSQEAVKQNIIESNL